MSTTAQNPYATPQAELEHVSGAVGGVTDAMLGYLRGTRGWVRFISVLLLVLALLTLLGALAMVAAAAMGGLGSFGYGLAGVYLLGVIFYALLGIYLFRYASAINRAVESGAAGDVEDALGLQRRFWRAASILGIIGCVFGAVSIAALPWYQQYLQGPLLEAPTDAPTEAPSN